jgi:alanine racemase
MNNTNSHSPNITDFYSILKGKQIITDSRTLIAVPNESIFFAFQGKHTDGNQFIKEMYQKGIRCFVVNEDIAQFQTLEGLFVKVAHTLSALQDLAIFHRSQFIGLEVIGITGSNGKTIVKEWLSQLLQGRYALVKSPKSYNSQLGVPLSVWQINAQHQLAIFEAGISKPKEMSRLAQIIQPTLGVFTNIGTAHDEGFANRQQKIREKLQLFTHCQRLIYCNDYEEINQVIAEDSFPTPLLTWGHQPNAHLQILHTDKQEDKTILSIQYEILNQSNQHIKGTYLLILPFVDLASVENCMHCVVVLLYLVYTIGEIQQLINQQFEGKNKALPMRLELKKGIHQCTLIDDTYTNDLQALSIALDFMNQQQHKHIAKRKTVILSDFLQTNIPAKEIYQNVWNLLINNQIEKFVAIGEQIKVLQELENIRNAKVETYFYSDTEAFIKDFLQQKINFQNEQILIKGARKFQFDRITSYLQEKVHGTRLEINLDALVHNLKFYRSLLKPSTQIMVMVKAFAYGSGSAEVASVLQYQNVDYLAVAYTDEGVHLRENGIRLPIMVMNPSEESFDKLVQYHLEPEIYSFRILKQFLAYIAGIDSKVHIHLKIDTGMRRLGFEPSEIPLVSKLLLAHPSVRVAAAFTHLAGADEAQHNEFSLHQLHTFRTAVHQLEHLLGYSLLKHALNSAGITRWADYQMDMVRLGIGLYGIEANGLLQQHLQNVTTLKTNISQIKQIKKGETVGYGRRWIAQEDSTIGTIAIGYADGYSRRFSHGLGKVLVRNHLAPIIGSVCMDMSMIDLTGIAAEEGDEVIVFGREVSVIDLAKAIHTIPYEIFTGIGERVKRVFFSE